LKRRPSWGSKIWFRTTDRSASPSEDRACQPYSLKQPPKPSTRWWRVDRISRSARRPARPRPRAPASAIPRCSRPSARLGQGRPGARRYGDQQEDGRDARHGLSFTVTADRRSTPCGSGPFPCGGRASPRARGGPRAGRGRARSGGRTASSWPRGSPERRRRGGPVRRPPRSARPSPRRAAAASGRAVSPTEVSGVGRGRSASRHSDDAHRLDEDVGLDEDTPHLVRAQPAQVVLAIREEDEQGPPASRREEGPGVEGVV